MNPMKLVLSAVDLLVSAGAGAVVGNLIKQSVPVDAKVLQKVSIAVGGFVLSGAAGSMASKYATDQINEGLEQFKELKAIVSKKKDN